LGCDRDEAAPYVHIDPSGDGLADFFKAGEIPKVREVPALLGFHGLHGAAGAFEEDALAAGSDFKSQPAAIGTQTGMELDEFGGGLAEVSRQSGNLRSCDAHLAGPTATGGTALAFVENWHGWERSRPVPGGNMETQ
jgi:hypothetical protein